MPITVPRAVLQLASEAGVTAAPTPDGQGIDIGDSESSHLVHRIDSMYQVQEVQRGTVKRPVLITAEESAVVRFLALVVATRWRASAGLAPLLPGEHALPDDSTVEKSGPRRYTLRWVEDGVWRRADDMVEYQALDLAQALAHPLDDVVAALRDPAGRPVFG